MIGKTRNVGQKHMFLPNLVELVNPEHELSLLAGKLDWDGIESGFASLYSDVGCPAKPIRLMVGLLLLKQMYDLADETVMLEWVSNPYFQYFCGETVLRSRRGRSPTCRWIFRCPRIWNCLPMRTWFRRFFCNSILKVYHLML
ncbi:hypothetical protein BH20ACI2_BH20ACI2_26770 [soil metagenome]